MNHMKNIIPYLETHAGRFEEELKNLLRMASISTDPEHQSDIEQAAHFIHDQFGKIGFTTEIMATDGHPVVYAEWLHANNQPTILVYGHYAVQPPDPIDLWTTPLLNQQNATAICTHVAQPMTKANCSHTSKRSNHG